MQIDLFGHPNSYSDGMMQQLMFNENAVHGIEDNFWQYYLMNKSERLERFRRTQLPQHTWSGLNLLR